ncbi:xanthoxin dehydrogenase isoform X1 [Tripterygium wilfordii]|uniref:Xanthoxin dehydrogenase isoform X1 n=1 Tax=Tripterygium wilfordii TaxID=458696 RepID=A0A7J7C637_TRIWF|nr:xanthoxin dehydrogenase-like [Tripterygium wilfordii]KAF5729307.1 xanthoxin dehydrogenase isoform X1 [Tripterygium wilfordii]
MSTDNTNSNDSSTASQRLLGRVALVTGGARGIGESIVRLLHKHGAKVCIVDVLDILGQQVCESLGGDPNASFFHGNVTIEDDISAAVAFTVGKFGTLDIMVNNAAVLEPLTPDIRDFDISTFVKTIDVNLKGVFIGMKHAARIMIPLKKGTIISISSIASVIGGGGPHAYTAAKHGVAGLTKNVAAELGKYGIRVNCISPFGVPTAMVTSAFSEEKLTEDPLAGIRSMISNAANLKGVELTTDDLANAVLFLASDEARYISGTNLPVDGGFTSVNHSFGFFS